MNLYAEKALEISKISIGHEERTTDWIHSRFLSGKSMRSRWVLSIGKTFFLNCKHIFRSEQMIMLRLAKKI